MHIQQRPVTSTHPLKGSGPLNPKALIESVSDPKPLVHQPSAKLQKQISHSQLLTEKNQELTSPSMRHRVETAITTTSEHVVSTVAHDLQESSGFSETRLGKRMQSVSDSMDSVQKTSQDLHKGATSLKKLASGDGSIEDVQQVSKSVSTVADLTGHSEVSKALGKAAAPLRMIDSAKQTKQAMAKLWEEPSVENLAQLGDKAAHLLDDVRETVEMLPGGKTLLKLAEKVLENPALAKAGRAVPGTNVAVAALDLINAIRELKKAKNSPNPKTVANAALGLVIAAGSLAAASNIPGISQMGATIATLADGIKTTINIDIGQLWKDTSSAVVGVGASVVNGICSGFSSMTSFLGWA